MQTAQWKTFVTQFVLLSVRQRRAGMALLHGIAPQEAVVALLENVVRQRLACPACHTAHLHRHGHAHGLQRYRCVPCGRTFNALTARRHPRARRCPRPAGECLSQPLARLAAALSWCRQPLSAALPGVALDTRCAAHPLAASITESNAGRLPTLDGDIAKKNAPRRARCVTSERCRYSLASAFTLRWLGTASGSGLLVSTDSTVVEAAALLPSRKTTPPR